MSYSRLAGLRSSPTYSDTSTFYPNLPHSLLNHLSQSLYSISYPAVIAANLSYSVYHSVRAVPAGVELES